MGAIVWVGGCYCVSGCGCDCVGEEGSVCGTVLIAAVRYVCVSGGECGGECVWV